MYAFAIFNEHSLRRTCCDGAFRDAYPGGCIVRSINLKAHNLETETIVLENLRCSQKGLTALGAYANAIKRHYGKKVIVDCNLVNWVEANIAAALGAIHFDAEENGSNIRFVNLKDGIESVLSRNGLFNQSKVSPHKTCIPLKRFELSDSKYFAEFTTGEFKKQDMPTMSEGLTQKFFEGLDELFINATMHSKSNFGVFACGQSYPAKNRLDFSLVDLGIGFKKNYENYFNLDTEASIAIDWAMKKNNTTRQGDIPGGLGLDILKEFIGLNKGRLTIFSGNGFWELSSSGIVIEELRSNFPGTFINLEIRPNDSYVYYLNNEIDPNMVL